MRRRKRHPSRFNAPGLGKSSAQDGCRISGRIWVERNGKTFLSWWRVVLLERIGVLGSITAAARATDMSYRHAWKLVEEMNRLSSEPLVAKAPGGRSGGVARLTPAGKAAVAGFWRSVLDFRSWMARQKPELGRG